MKTSKKIVIDKYIAKPIAYLLNFVVRLLGKILSIDHDLNKEFKTIAICKFKGMGSIIQATPMIDAIRKRYPEAQIIFVSTQSNYTFLSKIAWIDIIITVDDSSVFKFIWTNIKSLFLLIKIRPQIYFDLEIYSDYSTLFTLFSLSTNRVGFYLRSSSFRMGIYTQMMFFNPRVPISKVYLQLTQLINCDTATARLYSLLPQPPTELKFTNPYIVINPNASDLRLERRWGAAKFITLIQDIIQVFPDTDIVLVGSKDEQTYTTNIADAINHPNIKNTAGRTSIDGLISIIAHAKLMISNDTGPMHVAFCTKTPIIALFGPCSPEQYGVSEYAYPIYKPVYCSPCVHDFEIPPCKGNNVCMQLITTTEVFEKVQQLFQAPKMAKNLPKSSFFYGKGQAVFGRVER